MRLLSLLIAAWSYSSCFVSAVDCKWGQWEPWGDCPSGCDQEKTRIRQMVVEASCNGMECEGNDYEKKICSREEELSEQLRALLDENENLGKNQCPSDDRKMRSQHNLVAFKTFQMFQLMRVESG